MAEIFGKETGLCRGKGGHMHLFDVGLHFGCGGIVGGGIPHAVGAALAIKLRGEDRVAVAFFGEGAANIGAFHESVNLASVWKLPVVFVVEDNLYAISVPKSASTSVRSNAERGAAYGIPGVQVDGQGCDGGLRSRRRSDRAGAAWGGAEHHRGHLLPLPRPL